MNGLLLVDYMSLMEPCSQGLVEGRRHANKKTNEK